MLVPQAAAELAVSRFTVWKYIDSGRLPATRVGRDWIIRRSDLETFKGQRRKPGRPKKDARAGSDC